MKTTILSVIFLIVIIFSSCTQFDHKTEQGKVDTVGFYAARDMKGLGQFIIGQTTINDIVKLNKGILSDSNYIHNDYENWRYGELCGFEMIQEKLPYEKTYSFMEEKGFLIGNIRIKHLYLSFYRDTLYSINIHDDMDDSVDLLCNVFTHKYGTGVKDTLLFGTKTIIWKNQLVTTSYMGDYSSKSFEIKTNNSVLLKHIENQDENLGEKVYKEF